MRWGREYFPPKWLNICPNITSAIFIIKSYIHVLFLDFLLYNFVLLFLCKYCCFMLYFSSCYLLCPGQYRHVCSGKICLWQCWKLFIWLHLVLVATWSIFSCGIWILSHGMWDLVPWPGIEPGSPALGVWSLSHWITREVPACDNLNIGWLRKYPWQKHYLYVDSYMNILL